MAGISQKGPAIVGYYELISSTYHEFKNHIENLGPDYNFPSSTIRDLQQNCHFADWDIVLILGMAILWTILRWLSTKLIFVPISHYCKLKPKNQAKMPESAWKFIFYLSTWCYNIYLLFFIERYNFFNDPVSTWFGWYARMNVPTDIYILYMVQCSFYFHSIYATLFMDSWRKDSIVMLTHHFLTLFLIAFSYSTRYHNIGCLVLFLHDATDVILEFTKLNVYFKDRGNKPHRINELISTGGFIVFVFAWFLFRLYWFPLKAVYAAGAGGLILSKRKLPFLPAFNMLLWTLQLMNIYWFKFIVVLVYRVATGQMKEVEDTREYDIEFKESKKQENGDILSINKKVNTSLFHNEEHSPRLRTKAHS